MDINNRNDNDQSKNKKTGVEIYAVLLMVVSIVFCLVLITGGYIFGAFGQLLIHFILGVFGYAAYPIFIGLLIAGVFMFMKKRVTMSRRHIAAVSCMFAIGILCIHLFTTTSLFADMNYGKYLAYCYEVPKESFASTTGGGILSGLIVYPIAKYLSLPGAYIILIGAFIVSAVFSLDSVFSRLVGRKKGKKLNIDNYIDYPIDKPSGENVRAYDNRQSTLRPLYVGGDKAENLQRLSEQRGNADAETYDAYMARRAPRQQPVEEKPHAPEKQLFINTIGADYRPKKTVNTQAKSGALSILHADLQQNQPEYAYEAPEKTRAHAMDVLYSSEQNRNQSQSYTQKYQEDTKRKIRSQEELRRYIVTPPDVSEMFSDIINNKDPYSVNRKPQEDSTNKPQRIIHEPQSAYQPPQPQYTIRTPQSSAFSPKNNYTYSSGAGENLPYVGGGEGEPSRFMSGNSARGDRQPRREEPIKPENAYKNRYEPQKPVSTPEEPTDTNVEKVADFVKYRESRRRVEEEREQSKAFKPADEEDDEDEILLPPAAPEDDEDDEEDEKPSQGGTRFIAPAAKSKMVGGFEQMGIEEIDEPVNVSFKPQIPAAINPVTNTKIVKKPPVQFPPYVAPPIDLIQRRIMDIDGHTDSFIEKGKILESTLHEFGIPAKISGIVPGPTVTRYELSMPHGIKVKKVTEVVDDIALRLAATNIRIEAPIPGKSLFGIEVPNSNKLMVGLREVIDSQEFDNMASPLTFAIGKDVAGNNMVENICKMPHLLVAGATGTGKSVCLNTLIVSLLYKASPADVRLILVDPKSVEFSVYNGLPHMLLPSAITSPDKAISAFNWAIHEMERRYALFNELNAKNIVSYHQKYDPEVDEHLAYIVIIVDEFNDLMMVSKGGIEEKIVRLTQKARAAGIHLILATQRPSVDVISGTIKNNLPSRIAFTVASSVDSKTILDYGGAESLLGNGDMLYKSPTRLETKRLQGAFISEGEVENIVEFIKENNETFFDAEIEKNINSPARSGGIVGGDSSSGSGEDDRLIADALPLMIRANKATVNFLQTKLGVGYPRASRLIDIMEERGYVTPLNANEPRQVKITIEEYNQIFGGNE